MSYDNNKLSPVVIGSTPTQQALPGGYAAGPFRPVPGYKAQASECGVVLGIAGNPLRGSVKGRGGVYTPDGKYQSVALGRLVALAWLPNPQGLPNVLYKDGDITNCAVYNLVWSDATRRNKLGAATRNTIRARAAAGENLGQLAEEFGVRRSYVVKLMEAKRAFERAEAVLGW